MPISGNSPRLRDGDTTSTANRTAPIQDDQQTIISSRPPMAAPAMSDSANRILQGKIMPGDRLGHFDLVEYVGGGGMGRVFRAVDTRLDREVALKVLPAEQAADEETRLRFQNEARSAARLDHENIATVHYVGEDRGLLYIVFEFIEGMNIRALVEHKGPLSLAEAVSYTLQVAEALTHAAAREIVHRDIKPSNVLVMPDGRVKLIDMGLARLHLVNTSAAELTASGVTLGTFDYISPEQARDPRNADVRSDIYSLGCTFFYMLVARPPFPEGTVLQKLLQHQGDRPPEVRRFRPELPEEVERLLRKMLAKDPRHRYQDPSELVGDLLRLVEQAGLRRFGSGVNVPATPSAPKMSFFRRHLPWVAPIAALVCIVGALNLFWTSSGDSKVEPPEMSSPVRTALPNRTSDVTAVVPDELAGETAGAVAMPDITPEIIPQTVPQTTAQRKPVERSIPDPAERYETEGLLSEKSITGRLAFEALAGDLSAEQDAFYGLDAFGDDGTGPEIPTDSATAATAATPSSTSGAVAGTAVKRAGVLVVSDGAEGENEYRTLSAACSAATSGDVIELRYDGRRDERPVKLTNVKVTIRPGEGYRPVVVFRPDRIDPFKYARSMITTSSGRLTLIGVVLELHVPRNVPADSWSMVETDGDQAVRMERCSLTIYNSSDTPAAYHPEVSFFYANPALVTEMVIDEKRSAAPSATSIELVDCIVRGEADLLRCDDLQSISLDWENGLLAVTGSLLSAGSIQQYSQNQDDKLLSIDLRHVTAAIGDSLCRLSGTSLAPYRLPLEVNCSDSILMPTEAARKSFNEAGVQNTQTPASETPTNEDGVALIEQIGAGKADEFQRLITWSGDRNFYENFAVFWNIRGFDRKPLAEPMDFDAWQTYWGLEHENLPMDDVVTWRQLPEADRPLHTHTPPDYALDDSAVSNPAAGAASDGSNAGVQADRLPPLPVAIDTPPPAPLR